MTTIWKVQRRENDTWRNPWGAWTEDGEKVPLTFDTYADALAELVEHIRDCNNSDMHEGFGDYRIVPEGTGPADDYEPSDAERQAFLIAELDVESDLANETNLDRAWELLIGARDMLARSVDVAVARRVETGEAAE